MNETREESHDFNRVECQMTLARQADQRYERYAEYGYRVKAKSWTVNNLNLPFFVCPV